MQIFGFRSVVPPSSPLFIIFVIFHTLHGCFLPPAVNVGDSGFPPSRWTQITYQRLSQMAHSFPLALLSTPPPSPHSISAPLRQCLFRTNVHFPNWTRPVNRSSTVERCHLRPLKIFAYRASFLRSLTVFFCFHCIAYIYSYVRRPFLLFLYFFR